ncbi:MAG: hypothetical protein JWP82_1031 [Humibacillus sp.]|nr:hypothetical protein [Humibacillus sp.]
MQQVNPETIERVADLVGFAATALRDLATAQRERTAPATTPHTESRSAPAAEPAADESQEDRP